MVQVLVYYDEEDPPQKSSTSANDSPENSSEPRNETGRANRAQQPVQTKKTQNVQLMTIRLRTRLCCLPRADAIEVPKETWKSLRMYRYNRQSAPVETRQCVMRRASHSPLWTATGEQINYDSIEWATITDLHRLCLLPHCDYSLDLNSEVTPGKDFLEEHTQVMAYVVCSQTCCADTDWKPQ